MTTLNLNDEIDQEETGADSKEQNYTPAPESYVIMDKIRTLTPVLEISMGMMDHDFRIEVTRKLSDLIKKL